MNVYFYYPRTGKIQVETATKIEPDYVFIQNTRYTRVTAHCIIFDSIKALMIHIEANHEQEVNKYEQLLEKIKQKHKTLITYINERFG